jgi:hypothetical protein
MFSSGYYKSNFPNTNDPNPSNTLTTWSQTL